MNAQTIIDELEYAIKEYGLYTYHDKGADEVLDTQAMRSKLNEVSAEEEIGILKEVAKHKESAPLIEELIGLAENYDINGKNRQDELFETDEKFCSAYY